MGFLDWLVQSVTIGLTEHGPLILAAMGFALIYRLTGLINVAFAETITLGAYIGMAINTGTGLNFYLAIIPAAIATGVISVITYLAVFRPAKRRGVGVVEMIIMSFGLSVLLRYGLQLVFGYEYVYFDVPAERGWRILGVTLSRPRLISLGLVLLLAAALYWFIQKTRMGMQIRALAGDEKLAQVSGINPLAVTVLVWFIAGVAGGLAGAFWGVGAGFKYQLGWNNFLYFLLVVLIGGAKNIRGVIIAGLAFGVVLSGLSLWLVEVEFAQMLLIIIFMLFLKAYRRGLSEAGKV